MIKVKFFNMHMNRSSNPMDNYEEDKGYMESINNLYTMDKSYIWKGIQLTCEQDYDFAAIIDCIFTKNYFDPKKTILFRCEPKLLRDGFPAYNEAIKPSDFLKVYDMNALWGWIGLDYVELNTRPFNKTKLLSGIISTSFSTEMHQKRLLFVRNLTQQIPEYHHYGDPKGSIAFDGMPSYKGKIATKLEGLGEYKYHYNAENSREVGYFSEKFIDSILCECLTFYDGCLNLEDYVDPRAFIRIDLDDYEKSIDIIKTAMENNEWEKRIDIIRQEKKKILEKINILDLVWNAVHGEKCYFEK